MAGLHSARLGLKVLTGGIDTTSSTGRLVFGIFATLAEFERDLIRSAPWPVSPPRAPAAAPAAGRD